MRLKAILKLKCPHCLEGDVFRKPFSMYPFCPNCSIEYEREQGYFMMAVFVGYIMGFFIVMPVLGLMYLTVRPPMMTYLIGSVVTLLLTIPLIFHYARVVWMHLDELLDPRRESSS